MRNAIWRKSLAFLTPVSTMLAMSVTPEASFAASPPAHAASASARTDPDLAAALTKGFVVAVNASNLLPAARVQYDRLVGETPDLRAAPLYAETSDTSALPFVSAEKTMRGHVFVGTDEAGVRWTKPYVRDHVQMTDAALAAERASGRLVPAGPRWTASPAQNDAINRQLHALNARMRVTPEPTVLLDTQGTLASPSGMGLTTAEGHNAIILNEAVVHALSPRDIVALAGHETAHFYAGDNSAEGIVKAHNQPAYAVAREFRADQQGSGPLGTNDPAGMRHMLSRIRALGESTLGLPPSAARILTRDSDPTHPDFDSRIRALDRPAKPPGRGR